MNQYELAAFHDELEKIAVLGLGTRYMLAGGKTGIMKSLAKRLGVAAKKKPISKSISMKPVKVDPTLLKQQTQEATRKLRGPIGEALRTGRATELRTLSPGYRIAKQTGGATSVLKTPPPVAKGGTAIIPSRAPSVSAEQMAKRKAMLEIAPKTIKAPVSLSARQLRRMPITQQQAVFAR